MSLKTIRMASYRASEERLSSDNESLRDALEEALRRIAELETEVARLRGELPPAEDDE
ncbi:hypothetical protein SLH49_16340 [Cognatiyoonia sp. IB215446]|uniref:hypothetical protein n=1 Tax=Cognatiyoonia sp. IB215446 TaxID=3097355 RepID=UPI002A0D5E2F|nr:hypothetical protein [Cognatiyoonia sp. IB215446]MDX8349554.1 hypothetical protein [Cognatiyoonia sp. IB215446]